MGDFKKLLVWQRARETSVSTYRLTEHFPVSERYGLTSQLRRAATSIAANIAESQGRYSLNDQRRFLCIARGSAFELESHLILAIDLSLISIDEATPTLSSTAAIQKMLAAMIAQSRAEP